MDVKLAAYGIIKSGKSTVVNSVVASLMPEPVPVLPAAALECTALPTVLRLDTDRVGRVFSVLYRDGKEVDYPIEGLIDFRPCADAVGLVMYIPTVSKLPIILIDLPGLDSSVETAHNAAVEKFIADAAGFDVLLHVVEGTKTVPMPTSERLPAPRIVCINKIDQRIKWEDPTCSPESVRMSVVKSVRNRIAARLGQTEAMPDAIVAVSALAGLASKVWTEDIFESCLQMAHGLRENFAQLSARHYFGDTEEIGGISQQERVALADAASASLRGPWNDPTFKPAYPAIKFATGLAARETIETPLELREALLKVSGIVDLINVIATVANSQRVQSRRAHLSSVIRSQREYHEICRVLAETSQLYETTCRMQVEVSGSGRAKLEAEHFFKQLSAYLTTREDSLSERKHEIERYLARIDNEYRKSRVGPCERS